MGKRVMLVYGTRPEAIKMAPVVKALACDSRFSPVVVVTGQHREMLDQVNELFGIRPDEDLNLMSEGSSLTDIAARAMGGMGEAIRRNKPDVVVVQGDTTSAAIAALAAFYCDVPVTHLEAGLRTGNLAEPFPEEGNRRLIAPLATLHLAPTQGAKRNLLSEGTAEDDVVVAGNTVIDALYQALKVPVTFSNPDVQSLVASPAPYVLVTAHRRESWNGPLADAMAGLRRVAIDQSEVRFLVPMHRNPIVRSVLLAQLGDLSNVLLTEPLDYHQFAHAMKGAHLLLTDSGGIQEEGPSLGKPVLVMRRTTERPEAVAAGAVRLIGTSSEAVSSHLRLMLESDERYTEMANAVNPYGDGMASERSVAALAQLLGVGNRIDDFAVEPHA